MSPWTSKSHDHSSGNDTENLNEEKLGNLAQKGQVLMATLSNMVSHGTGYSKSTEFLQTKTASRICHEYAEKRLVAVLISFLYVLYERRTASDQFSTSFTVQLNAKCVSHTFSL